MYVGSSTCDKGFVHVMMYSTHVVWLFYSVRELSATCGEWAGAVFFGAVFCVW